MWEFSTVILESHRHKIVLPSLTSHSPVCCKQFASNGGIWGPTFTALGAIQRLSLPEKRRRVRMVRAISAPFFACP